MSVVEFVDKEEFEDFMWKIVAMIPNDQLPDYVTISDDSYWNIVEQNPKTIQNRKIMLFKAPNKSILIKSNYQNQVETIANELVKQVKRNNQ